ncbi:GroES-like protein [Lophium mytilinum]|uniref:GroES-like protein n=1 Tax=Lophium mytilinum TaxID=390894 RepID=A0A6A6RAF3_9PEZI|nr:GroES-like protein [Lophium mytilinum]
MSTTIRKAVITGAGDVSNISVTDGPISAPERHHVQVRVLYSGFSGSDINMRLGIYPFQKKAPFTPGYCLIGRVNVNGRDSQKFAKGALVACLSVYDAEAELANLPEKYLIPVPEGLDLQQATALILDWNTAYGMVMHTANVSSGQRVFVHGMSGAVGYAVTILAQLQGAEVYGTASPKNHDAIKQLGATPFTYANKDWISAMTELGGVHAVFDALGFESWDESYSILTQKERSILVGYGGNLPMLTGQPPRSMTVAVTKLLAQNMKICKRRTTFYYIGRDDKTFVPDLTALFDLLKQGKIQVPIKRVYGLEEVPQAHKSWNTGAGMGSLLVKIADDTPA